MSIFKRVLLFAAIFLAVGAFASPELFAEYRTSNLWGLPENVSDRGESIDRLFWIIFWLTGVVFFATQFLLFFYCARYRKVKGGKAIYNHGNNKFEVIWTLIPTIIFVVLFIYSNDIWNRIHKAPPQGALQVEAIAEQYGFNFRFPGPDGKLGRASYELATPDNKLGLDKNDPAGADDIVTYNEFVAPVNQPIHILMRSRDVIHAFYVPQFRLYQDMVPGRTIEWVWITLNKTGKYEIACNQLCGAGHYNMKSKVEVMSLEDYNKWVSSMSKPAKVASAQ